jgi:hypothetical protein
MQLSESIDVHTMDMSAFRRDLSWGVRGVATTEEVVVNSIRVERDRIHVRIELQVRLMKRQTSRCRRRRVVFDIGMNSNIQSPNVDAIRRHPGK